MKKKFIVTCAFLMVVVSILVIPAYASTGVYMGSNNGGGYDVHVNSTFFYNSNTTTDVSVYRMTEIIYNYMDDTPVTIAWYELNGECYDDDIYISPGSGGMYDTPIINRTFSKGTGGAAFAMGIRIEDYGIPMQINFYPNTTYYDIVYDV